MTSPPPVEVLLVSSEALPYSKTGGLADVVGSLAKALARRGCRVRLFQPLYRTVRERFPGLEQASDDLQLEVGGQSRRVGLFRHRPWPGVTAYLVREDSLFDREGLYGEGGRDYADNDLRFAVFCRTVLAAAGTLRCRPRVIHCHDWQSALVPLYLRHRPSCAPGLEGVPVVLTIHNLAYQGLFPPGSLGRTDIPRELFHMEGVEFYGKVNLLKGGILSADAITTVSPRYSREIQTPEFGAGLHGVLRGRARDLHGILNGIDYETWDPATDPHLTANFSARDRAGKERCKTALLEEFGLPADPNAPLLATISRLVEQKGFDLIAPVMPDLLDLGFRYLLLGSGDGALEGVFRDIARRHPGRMAVRIAYDETLAHRIEAGADFFLMPSRFEPCGLNQLYSLRYGTVPVVRAVGGLDDTVTDYDPATGRGNGFKFEEYTPEALSLKAHEAFLVYRRPAHMAQVIGNGMAEDFSWERSAGLYVELYRRLAASRSRPA